MCTLMVMGLEGSAKFTPEFGGGYIGFLEVSHQMHVRMPQLQFLK